MLKTLVMAVPRPQAALLFPVGGFFMTSDIFVYRIDAHRDLFDEVASEVVDVQGSPAVGADAEQWVRTEMVALLDACEASLNREHRHAVTSHLRALRPLTRWLGLRFLGARRPEASETLSRAYEALVDRAYNARTDLAVNEINRLRNIVRPREVA